MRAGEAWHRPPAGAAQASPPDNGWSHMRPWANTGDVFGLTLQGTSLRNEGPTARVTANGSFCQIRIAS